MHYLENKIIFAHLPKSLALNQALKMMLAKKYEVA
jgi:hypothetical protein